MSEEVLLIPIPNRMLVHQVHPAKLAVDVAASLVSDWLLWHRRTRSGLVVRYLPSIVVSAVLLSCADLEQVASTRAGRYVTHHMSPGAMATRLLGDGVMAVASWRRNPALLAGGAMLIAIGWSAGLVRPRNYVR